MSDNQDKQEPFDRMLQQWQVTTPLPPRFQESVWRKIESAAAQVRINPAELIRRWFESFIPRPAVAASYVGILLVAGLLAGTWHAQEHNARAEHTFARKYVQSVDPYQAPRL